MAADPAFGVEESIPCIYNLAVGRFIIKCVHAA